MKEIKADKLHTLIPLEDFKAVMGVDDREDKTARFCLVTATLAIEQYCRRKFLRKKYFENMQYTGSLVFPFREYPVSEILAVFALKKDEAIKSNGLLIEPEFYRPMLGNGFNEEYTFELLLSPSVKRFVWLSAIKVIYWGGYKAGTVPADLVAACLELASWNMNRYRGKRIGMSGNIRGAGIQGEHFELSMPENVRGLIEPYRRKTI